MFEELSVLQRDSLVLLETSQNGATSYTPFYVVSTNPFKRVGNYIRAFVFPSILYVLGHCSIRQDSRFDCRIHGDDERSLSF